MGSEIKRHFWRPWNWTRIKDSEDFQSPQEARSYAERLLKLGERIETEVKVGLLYVSSVKVQGNYYAVILKAEEGFDADAETL